MTAALQASERFEVPAGPFWIHSAPLDISYLKLWALSRESHDRMPRSESPSLIICCILQPHVESAWLGFHGGQLQAWQPKLGSS